MPAREIYQQLPAFPATGMKLDNDVHSLKAGDVTFAMNYVLGFRNNKTPYYSFIESNDINTVLPKGNVYLGSCALEDRGRCIFSVVNNISEIGVMRDGVYTMKVQAPLGFKANFPIQAEAKKNLRGETYVYWVERNNPFRYMNLDNPPLVGGVLNVEAINVFRNYKTPYVQVTDVTSGGVLLAGSYYVSVQYADANGNGLSRWFTPIGPIPIYRDSISQPYEFISGSPVSEPTGKAIKLSLSNLDTNFQYLNIGITRSMVGARRSVIVSSVPITQTDYLYTGAEGNENEFAIAELGLPAVVYKSAGTICNVAGQLVLGDLKRRKEYNLQSHFLDTHVQWQVFYADPQQPTNSYKNPLFTTYKKGYARNEVVPLGIILNFKDGSKSPVYHFPGVVKNRLLATPTVDQFGNAIPSGQWDSYIMPQSDDSPPTGNPERWKMYNTAYVTGTDLNAQQVGPGEFGELSYWESTERYPNIPSVWGALAGLPIRHPKTPDCSIVHIHDGEGAVANINDPIKIKILGFRFPNLPTILNSLPQDVKDAIDSWEIVRGDRQFSSSVIANGLFYNVWARNWTTDPNSPADVRIYPNYPYNDLRPDPHYEGDDPAHRQQMWAGTYYHLWYLNDTFSFYSPDTTFEKGFLSGFELNIPTLEYGKSEGWFSYMRPFPMLAASNKDGGGASGGISSDNDKYVVQYNSYAFYKGYKKSTFGNYRRDIKEAIYVPYSAQISGGGIGYKIHNLLRESSVFFAISKALPIPSVQDRSRSIFDGWEQGVPANELFGKKLETAGQYRSWSRFRPVSAYYGSIRNPIPNQYGSIFNIKYYTTGYNSFNTTNTSIVFGGDVFITLMSLKRSMPFYQEMKPYAESADRPDIDLRYTQTITGTRFYYRKADDIQVHSINPHDSEDGGGYVPTIHSGAPCFWCESKVNTDLRPPGTVKAEAYYPNLQDNAVKIEEWEGITTIDTDNAYLENEAYSEQNDLVVFSTFSPFYDPITDLEEDYYNRVIWSLKQLNDSYVDQWLIFKSNNYWDFPNNKGRLLDIRYLGMFKTIYRFEKTVYIEGAYSTMETSENDVLLGTGKLFSREPAEQLTTDMGYTGTQSQWAFNSTPFGHFMIDEKSGSVFQYVNDLKDVSANDASGWFERNLPFKMLKDIPLFPNKDNPANPDGIGFSSGYDHQNKLILVTKHDYELVNKSDIGRITFQDGRILYDGIPISLKDDTKFANRSWTIGYSPLTQMWVSFYSFMPGAYFNIDNGMYSIQHSMDAAYLHNTSRHYRTFYGKTYKAIIEMGYPSQGNSGYTDWTKINARVYKYANDISNEHPDVIFTHGLFYNDYQCTGKLPLIIEDELKLTDIRKNWFSREVAKSIVIRRTSEYWGINEIYDISTQNKFFLTDDWSLTKAEFPIDKVIDPTKIDFNKDYKEVIQLRDTWLKARYFFDNTDPLYNLVVYVTSVMERMTVR